MSDHISDADAYADADADADAIPASTEVRNFSWKNVQQMSELLAMAITQHSFVQNRSRDLLYAIIAVSRGGLIPATILSHQLDIRDLYVITSNGSQTPLLRRYERPLIVVDDICDTGATFKWIKGGYPSALYVSLIVKPKGLLYRDLSVLQIPQTTWAKFPWELSNKEDVRDSNSNNEGKGKGKSKGKSECKS